jgi:hypothetical protein
MAAEESQQAPDLIRRLFTVRNGSLLFIAFCIGATLISVGITAAVALALGARLDSTMGNVGQIFESVNAAFAGLGFIALVVTFRLQYDELVLQRQELESQRHAMDKTQVALHHSATADIRLSHLELMRMSINDTDLAEVWPDVRTGLSAKATKQLAYANLIVQHQQMLHTLDLLDSADLRSVFDYLFTNQLMRNFWEARILLRQATLKQFGTESAFEQIVDVAYADAVPTPPSTPPDDHGGDVIDFETRR